MIRYLYLRIIESRSRLTRARVGTGSHRLTQAHTGSHRLTQALTGPHRPSQALTGPHRPSHRGILYKNL